MSEERVPYGNEAQQWEKAAAELRGLMGQAGLTQVAAAHELDYSERAIRGFCSGREPVPRAVLYAMRYIVEHLPNRERWLQVHWKKAGITVTKGDQFSPPVDTGKELVFKVNGKEVIRGALEDLQRRGIVSIHTSYSSDRFRLPEFVPAGQAAEKGSIA